MKTLREILLARHQAAVPRLDAIRKTAVASVGDRRPAKAMDMTAVTDHRYSLRDFLLSLRWHLAGMGAVWVVAAILQLNASQSSGPVAVATNDKIPSAKIIIASLRENREQLLELIQPAESRTALPAKPVLRSPRSERQHDILRT